MVSLATSESGRGLTSVSRLTVSLAGAGETGWLGMYGEGRPKKVSTGAAVSERAGAGVVRCAGSGGGRSGRGWA